MHDIRPYVPLGDPNRFPPTEYKPYPKQLKHGIIRNGVQVDPGVIAYSEAEEKAWLAAQAAKETPKVEEVAEVRRGPGRPRSSVEALS